MTDSAGPAPGENALSWIAWFPNSLTVARLLAGIAFPFVPTDWWLGWLLFGGITDLIDGWISRMLRVTSLFGQLLDPVADKAFVLAAVGTFLWHGRLTWGELLLIAARDIAVLGLTALVLFLDRSRLGQMQPRLSGKVATAGQFLYLLAAAAWPDRSLSALLFAGGLSLYAAIDYWVVGMRALKRWRVEQT